MTPGEFEMLLSAIARIHLHVYTLETRHCDRLDFHDCAVWSIRDALIEAFNAGVVHGRRTGGSSS